MPKKHDETNIDYRKRVIDKVSDSFCAAKWLNATIWLNNGMTASCHHPPAHHILDHKNGESLEDLKKNPSMIHNTTYKKQVRKQMLDGQRPKECEYCWKIEDLGDEQVSDRVFKTVIYDDKSIEKCHTEYKESKNVNLKTLEIAFDANCNFSCSYCNPSFSTAWQRDIHKNGPYENLVSDGARAYQHDGSWVKQFAKEEENPYVTAFWDWWPELSKEITELRVTGGEATISPEFWRLIEWWKKNPDNNIQFAVNSNLGVRDKQLDQLIDASNHINNFVLYTSCEATGSQAEYIRDGLNWNDWKIAVERMLTEGNVKEMNVMMTINSLCLYSLTDFMDYCNDLKSRYGKFYGVFSVNILRFPSFMSPGTLPQDLREERANQIESWLEKEKNHPHMHEMEIDAVKRLISYLREVHAPHRATSSIESRHRDFKSFYKQYDLRRDNKNFCETFPLLKQWYNSIPDTEIESIEKLYSGDSSLGWNKELKEELAAKAKREGWVLEPQASNPGAKDYSEKKYGLNELVDMELKNLQAIYQVSSVEKMDTSWDKKRLIEEILKLSSS